MKKQTLHYDKIVIAEAQKSKDVVGKTIQHIAQSGGLSPEETVIEILISNDLGVTVFSKTLMSTHLVSIAREPYSMFSSDGVGEGERKRDLTHPRSYGAFPRFLHRLVVKGNILSWEEAVKKMTSVPASLVGLGSHRGLLKQGYFADVVILDPKKIIDMATYRHPYQYPHGIDYVFVNGNCAFKKGKVTGALAGKFFRRSKRQAIHSYLRTRPFGRWRWCCSFFCRTGIFGYRNRRKTKNATCRLASCASFVSHQICSWKTSEKRFRARGSGCKKSGDS